MKGRKPDANAIKRIDQPKPVQATLVDGSPHPPAVEKPPTVAMSETQSAIWDLTVGTGACFEERDTPLLEQLVFLLDVAREARARTVDKDGRPILMVGKGPVDEVTGEYLDYAPNPYIKQAEDATNNALKLADQLGCTPLARARLGLAQSMDKAAKISIAEQIDRAIRDRQ